LGALEPQLVAFLKEPNANVERQIAALRALREMNSSRADLFAFAEARGVFAEPTQRREIQLTRPCAEAIPEHAANARAVKTAPTDFSFMSKYSLQYVVEMAMCFQAQRRSWSRAMDPSLRRKLYARYPAKTARHSRMLVKPNDIGRMEQRLCFGDRDGDPV